MIEFDWLDPDDVLSGNWVPLDDEVEGSTPDSYWVKNVDTQQRALFKPDTIMGDEARREYSVYKIASFLGICCAKINVGTMFGKYGCISYDTLDRRRYRPVDGYALHRCDSLFHNKSIDSNNLSYSDSIEVSLRGLIPYITENVELDLAKMLLDCIVKNCDRHPGNFSFVLNYQKAICGLLPLYDHGLSLREDLRDISLFPYEGVQGWSFLRIYQQISQTYPELVLDITAKISTHAFTDLIERLQCSSFIKDRLMRLRCHNRGFTSLNLFK